jgi:hypothetical protein
MKIENATCILYFFVFLLSGAGIINSDFISCHQYVYSCTDEDRAPLAITEDSQDNNKDIYRRTGQNVPVVKNSNFVYIAVPVLNFQSVIDCSIKSYFSYSRSITVSLAVQDLIYPFNDFL